jgi:uncharacterized DUF497 family protein
MIEFTWDVRKARRNEREHGVSFPIAQAAIESRLGVEVEEQFREGEWRTIIIAPFRGILLLHITIAFYPGEDDDTSNQANAEDEQQVWHGEHGIIRIISARKAMAHEQGLYFAARPTEMG